MVILTPPAPQASTAAAPENLGPDSASTTAVPVVAGDSLMPDNPAHGIPTDLEALDKIDLLGSTFSVTPPAPVPLAGPVTPPALVTSTPPVAPAPAVVPARPPEQQPAPAAPAPSAEPAGAPAIEPGSESERILPGRINTHGIDREGQAALAMQHALNAGKTPGDDGYVSLADCVARVQGPPKPVTPPPPPQPSASQVALSRVQEAESTLADLRAQRAEQDGFGGDLASLDEQIAAAEKAVRKADVEAALAERDDADAQVRTQVQAYEQKRQAMLAVEKAVAAEFPTVTDKKSPLGARVQSLVRAMEDPSHPDYSVLDSPNSARFVTLEAAKQVAMEMVTASQGTAAPLTFAQAYASLQIAPEPAAVATGTPPPAPGEPRRILPQSGSLATPPPAPPMNEQQLLAHVGTDPEKLDALFGGGSNYFIGQG